MLVLKGQWKFNNMPEFHDTGIAYHNSGFGVFNKNFQNVPTLRPHSYYSTTHFSTTGNFVRSLDNTSNIRHKTINENFGLSPYFDSTVGVTAGNRYIALYSSAGNTPGVMRVAANGELEHLYEYTNNTSYVSYIFAENASYFFVISFHVLDTVSGATGNDDLIYFGRVSKATGVGTQQGSSLLAHTANYMGIVNDCALFITNGYVEAAANTGNNTYNKFYGFVQINLATSAMRIEEGAKVMVSGYNTNYVGAPVVDGAGDFVAYTGFGGSNVGVLGIYRYKTPGTLNYASVAADQVCTACTVVGLPADVLMPVATGSSGTTSISYVTKTYTIQMNGATYVVMSQHAGMVNANTQAYQSKYNISLFKVEEDGVTLTYKHHYVYNRVVTAVLQTPNKTQFIACESGASLQVISINAGSETFTVSDVISATGLSTVNVDDQGDVWATIYDSTTTRGRYTLSKFSIANSAVVKAVFEAQSLQWTGSPVETNILLNAFDAFGNRLARQVNVLITGAEFTNGGGTLQQFTTSTTADTTISLTIKNPGQISVVPSLV